MGIGNGVVIKFIADTTDAVRGVKKLETAMGATLTPGEKLNKMSGALKGALVGAGVAAGAFATALAVEGVKAAIEDEAAVSKLNKTLDNLGFDTASASVQEFIDKTQMSTGVADDQLRPSLERLLIATNNLQTSQQNLSLALDIAAGTGRSVEQVSNALARGWEGSTTALGKLGVGIDKANLQQMTMSEITTTLSQKFNGQAAAAAETYQGKINRLNVAMSEAKETIGYALLNAVDDISRSFGGVDGFQDAIAQTSRGAAGLIEQLGWLTSKVIGLGNATEDATKQDKYSEDTYRKLVQVIPIVGTYLSALSGWHEDNARAAAQQAGTIDYLINKYEELAGRIQASGLGVSSGDVFSAAMGGTPTGGYTDSYVNSVNRLIIANRNAARAAREAAAANRQAGGSTSDNSAAVEAANAIIKDHIGTLTSLEEKLKNQTTEYETAKKAIDDWSASMRDSLLGGINLGDAYSSQFDEAGQKTGKSLVDAFDAQIAQAKWFGNVLTEIKRQGADQSLIDQIASLGPATGGALGQQLITDGLIKTMSDKLVDVEAAATTTANSLVPSFLIAGAESAKGFLETAITEVKDQIPSLKKVGDSMGKIIGSSMKSEIADAIASAIKSAEAAKAAAAAETAAQAASRAVGVTEQQVAQALQRLVTNSNARTGYQIPQNSMGIVLV